MSGKRVPCNNDLGCPAAVSTTAAALPVDGDSCRLALPPHSVNVLRLKPAAAGEQLSAGRQDHVTAS